MSLINILKETNVSAFLDKWGPVHVLHVYDPDINMYGILVIDNTTLGPGCGGISIKPTITPYEVFKHARTRTLSCALVDIKMGGAAGGIRTNPGEIDLDRAIRSFANEVSPFVPEQYIAAPDVNFGQDEIAKFVDELGDRKGATGKPVKMSGIPHEQGVVGFGMGVVIDSMLEAPNFSSIIPSEISKCKIAIHGFDNIGFTVAKYLFNKGATVVAISDPWGMAYDAAGIDIDRIVEYAPTMNEKHSLSRCYNNKKLPIEDIIRVDCDILITASGENIITEDNIGQLNAKCVVEGPYKPLSDSVYQILQDRGVIVIPEILSTAGGVISSYAEYNMNSSEMAFSLIDSLLRDATRRVTGRSLEFNLSLRRVVREIAMERILSEKEVGI